MWLVDTGYASFSAFDELKGQSPFHKPRPEELFNKRKKENKRDGWMNGWINGWMDRWTGGGGRKEGRKGGKKEAFKSLLQRHSS